MLSRQRPCPLDHEAGQKGTDVKHPDDNIEILIYVKGVYVI